MGISARLTYVPATDLLDEPVPTTRAPRRGIARERRLAGAGLALAGLPLLTLALDALPADALSLEGEVLLFLLAVVLVSLAGGLVVGLPAAVAAALLINFFFVAPRHTLDVARGDQLVALAVFVVVAAIVSAITEVAVRRARAAALAAEQAETLSALAGADLDEDSTLPEVLEHARRTFDMASVVLLARDRATGTWDEVERSGARDDGEALQFDVPMGPDLRLLGRGPALFAEDRRVLQAFAAAAETAYEGRRLTTEARRAKALDAVDRQRTALLAAVGHDLRTPLTGIKTAVSSLRAGDVEWSPADRDALLETIEGSADRLEAVVANLLDASRLEAGAVSVHPEPVALVQVVASAVLAVPDAGERVEVAVPDDLPLVRADAGMLERVLANLIDNALRHGGDGVRVEAAAGAESAKLAVIDHGPGIPEARREQVFEAFQRLDDRGAGLGLGLSVARGFVEAMDGALVADHSPGGGLTMRLRLPLAERRR